ncbi:MAG TPA: alkaline phosphatase family protein, partial [Rhodocyclaceae bacterium]|nr:alkaline phosphatase family protein [Rhodocyclaceae bacterium]
TSPESMCIPSPDPGEAFTDMNMQLFGVPNVSDPAPAATMQGFAKNYQAATGQAPQDNVDVMHYFVADQVPVLTTLAIQFAVSDRWHASAPCQTWPNRFFAHTGTANGYENNSPPHFPYLMPTVFNRFKNDGITDNGWKIYFHDMPQTLTLSDLWLKLDRFRFYDEFRHDASEGTLPSYSFIEPRYFTDTHLPNDQHPPHNATLGEQLIADVYNCLRSGPAWNQTLLIVTYDEHGGCYDHVAPPKATPPSTQATAPFNFDRYGVRVPAIIVSPYIKPGTVLRPSGPFPFDHTSIISTLRKRFNLGAPLTNRDADAPDQEAVLALDTPDNQGPDSLQANPYAATPSELANAKNIPLNDMQKMLLELSKRLPINASAPAVASHIAKLSAEPQATVAEVHAAAAEAQEDISAAVAAARTRLDQLFGSL